MFRDRILHEIDERLEAMSAQLDALTSQVAQNTTVEGSAVTLIQGIAKQISDAIAANEAGDATALTNLATSLNTSATALAAAVAAGTPVASSTSPAATAALSRVTGR